MMSRKLPPLNPLRAFEAAGRHLSFTKAATELNVTHAAISHQVKALEERLGVPLFHRLNRAVRLTDEGQGYLPVVRDAFDEIARATEKLTARDRRSILTVSLTPSLAAKWLVPRLDHFREAHPDIDVRIDASTTVADFAHDEVDLAIRYGPGHYPGHRVDRLFTDEVFPVCSPGLLEGPHPLREPDDLRWHTLIHTDFARPGLALPDWRMWLHAAGIDDIDASRGPRFTRGAVAIQIAIEGRGVALSSAIFVHDDLAEGRLVRPFALSLPVNFAHFLVCPEATAEQPKIVAFRDWIMAEAAEDDTEERD